MLEPAVTPGSKGPGRRAVAVSAAGALAAIGIAGCSGTAGPSARPPATPPVSYGAPPTGGALPATARVTFGAPTAPLVMQVMAHPDDDLYFMNPDTAAGIDREVPVVSVYVTSGDSFGVNRAPGRSRPLANVPAYVSARQQGLRQAYARMLGAEIFTPWTRTALALPGGGAAEVDTLRHGGRRAELVFLRIDMHTPVRGGGTLGIDKLWAKDGTVRTVPLPDGPVRGTHTFDRQSLIDALAFLMATFRPTLIRTLDPDPDIQIHNARNPKGSDQGGYSDHRDHTATALFTWRAMSQWTEHAVANGGPAPVFLTEAYRGYYNQRWPHNLPQAAVRFKAEVLDVYGGSPDWHCGDIGGCGDYGVGQGDALKSPRGWVRSTHYRYPTAGPKAVAAKDGRLTVYGVLGTRAARWTETAPGRGQWNAPEDLGGGPLAPALSVVTDKDGRHLLFGLRFSGLEGEPDGNTREIVLLDRTQQEKPEKQGGHGRRPSATGTALRSDADHAIHGWLSLGNPEANPVRGRRVGPPTAVTGKDGRVHLFVRNASKGLSTRVRDTSGRWSPWRKLSGGQVQEGLAATVDHDGRIHVFAAGHQTLLQWTQGSPKGELVGRPLRQTGVPGEVPEVVTATDGSLLLAFRRPETAEIAVERLDPGRGGHWKPAAAVRDAGFGPVALLGGRAAVTEPLLAVRADFGNALLVHGKDGAAPAAAGANPPAATPFAVGRPAVLPAGHDRTALVSFGVNAVPAVTRSQGIGTYTQLATR
ncbi:PIG-L family deacetylase [Actinacidiphila alni]|uniref:PIG-L family deacetylase n=1 Tax=Actinacidiphila alni TaxID=380248 RepID=UPI0033C2C465